MIPHGRQDITQTDIDAIAEVLRSGFLTQEPAVPRFEQAVASRVNVKHAVAVNNATSAPHIACLALGLGEGDRLWTVPNTFVASGKLWTLLWRRGRFRWYPGVNGSATGSVWIPLLRKSW